MPGQEGRDMHGMEGVMTARFNEPDLEEKLAEKTGIRGDVIRAIGYGREQLTELYNKASEAAKWARIGKYGMYVMAAAIVGSLFTEPGTMMNNGATVAMLGGFLTFLTSMHKQGGYAVNREIQQAANDRLVELDRKERGQAPGLQA